MPELPEVETIARELDRCLSGEAVVGVRVMRRDVVHGDRRSLGRLIRGRRVARVFRRAKRVIVDLEPDRQLVFHLGMSGRLTVESADVTPEVHTHVRVRVGDGRRELRFRDPRRFGGVWCFADGAEHIGYRLGPLGAEPLELTLRSFRTILNRKRQIKALLLDQRVIAGLGNIYCDESLFGAGLHPQTRANELSGEDARRLLRSIKTVLRRAISYRGSTLVDYRQADGTEGSYQKYHRVYNREGKPCRRCRTPIVRCIAAGRSTFFCPACQQRV